MHWKNLGEVMSRFILLLIVSLPVSASELRWSRQVVDKKFHAEGIAVADVNKDGKLDLITGEYWYEGPEFKIKHEMQLPGDYGDGFKGYSHTFAVFADDINNDGWIDAIVIDFPGTPCFWLENPKDQPGHWKKHTIWHSACNETPLYKDLFGTGQRVLIMGFQPKYVDEKLNLGLMAYFKPGKDPTSLWVPHIISHLPSPDKPVPGTQRFSHGLGVGDLNGDGRLDIMTSGTNTNGQGGWWEQPAKLEGKPWTFHPFPFGDACADMYAYDCSGTGKPDILATSAHRYGIWQLKRRGDSFEKTTLFPDLVSETHAAVLADVDGDGLPDLVTGKRFWSHGKNEPGADKPAYIYWLQAKRSADGIISFKPREIDNDSGIGTQFEVVDLNGDSLLDVVTANKKGVFVLRQSRK